MKKNLIRQYLFNYPLNHCDVFYFTEEWYKTKEGNSYWKRELHNFRDLLVLKDLGLITLNKSKSHSGIKIYIPKIIADAKERFLKSYYSIPRNVYSKSDWQ
jgi:hypothetical protein